MDQYAAVFGRLHPLLLHLPIGLLFGVVALEAVGYWRGERSKSGAPAFLLWLTAAAALAAIVTGLTLSYEDGYGGWTLDVHLWLGLAFGAAVIVAAFARSAANSEARPGALKLYRASLVVVFLLMLGAGHFGAAMTHGDNFLFEPLSRATAEASPETSSTGAAIEPVSFASLAPASAEGFERVRPILTQRCALCHSETRHKAGLALDTFDAVMNGGDAGTVVEMSDPEASELLRRITLPIDDPEHMPPEGKRQLTPEETETLRAWILGNTASAEGAVASTGETEGSSTEETAAAAPTTPAVAPANAAAVEALAATLAHVSPLAEGSGLLWVNASYANPPLEEQQLLDLLRPLAPNIAELTLSNCNVTDAFAELAAQMPNLRRLNLSQTAVSDLTVAALAEHPALMEIILAKTAVTDASTPSLLAMPALERVYLWNSLYTPEAIERLRAQRPDLVADAGEFAESTIVAVEPEPKFVDAGPTTAAPAKLTAVNTMCPVSGTAVDARYLVVHEGKVIGFCCTECPKQFWADPAKYLEKLKP